MSSFAQDTIVAIATSLSPASIGVVRLSGDQAIPLAQQVFTAFSTRKLAENKGYTASFGEVHDQEGRFDEAVALVFRAPKSFTGEDVVELSVHGGIYLVKRLLRALLAAGARMAEPGEFTRRAYRNGKLSLSQAEAIADLIMAQGGQAARAALAVQDGKLAAEIGKMTKLLVGIAGHIAAYSDYPDEDIADVSHETILNGLTGTLDRITLLLEGFEQGSIVKSGVDTVIIGKPNVGKSTLMNLLSGFEKSIVTDIAGTTRDIVEDTVNLGDITLRLADTAGLRETKEPIEAVGVERAKNRLKSAALVLAVFDSSQPLSQEDVELIEQLKERPCVAVVNKSDLPPRIDMVALNNTFSHVVNTNAADGEGMDALVGAIREILFAKKLDDNAMLIITERQRDCAIRAKQELEEAVSTVKMGFTLDAVGVAIESAIAALLELTGETATQAVVDEVFSKFCVGK